MFVLVQTHKQCLGLFFQAIVDGQKKLKPKPVAELLMPLDSEEREKGLIEKVPRATSSQNAREVLASSQSSHISGCEKL